MDPHPSTCGKDEVGIVHRVPQGEGGELFSLGQYEALDDVNRQLRAGEYLFAFLDYIYPVTPPNSVREKVTSQASLLSLAEWRRLFSTESRLSRSVCRSGCIRKEKRKRTGEAQVEVDREVEENQGGRHMCDMA